MFIHTYEIPTGVLDDITWHVAAFKHPQEQRGEITSWCYKSYGAPGINSNTQQIRWKNSINWGEVYFRSKQDLEWFVLRWA